MGKQIGTDTRVGAVSTFLKQYDARGTLNNNYKGNSNKKKALTERDIRNLIRLALANRRAPVSQLCEWLGVNVSDTTIRNALKANGINARRPVKKPRLSKEQRTTRLN